MKNTTKTYTECAKLATFEERFRYLRLNGKVAEDTFGIERWLNQVFYKSSDWTAFRNEIIIRDLGCDLGLKGYELRYGMQVHHIEPITKQDIVNRNVEKLLNPENAILTSAKTHKAIHYGDASILGLVEIERKPNDTIPWRQ